MECLIDAITNNAITDLQTGILDAKFDITQKNKEDLVKKAADCGNVECLKILIQSGYPVSDGWDSPVKPAAAKGNHSYNIEYKLIHYKSDIARILHYLPKVALSDAELTYKMISHKYLNVLLP